VSWGATAGQHLRTIEVEEVQRLRGGAPKPKSKATKAKIVNIKTKKSAVEEWWFGYPFITRYWFALCVVTTLVSWERIPFAMPATSLILHWPAVLRLQVWRLLTTFTYFGSVGHNMLMETVFMLNYSKSLEVMYSGRRAQYLWHLMLNGAALMGVNFLLGLVGVGMDQEDGSKLPGIPFLAQPLLYSIVWMWTRQNPEVQMSVFGFFNVKAVYFPWFLLAYHLIMGGGLNIFYLMGFIVGHIFFFLNHLHPATKGLGVWNAPLFLENLLPLDGASASKGGPVQGAKPDDADNKAGSPPRPSFVGKGARLGKK